MLQVNDLIKPVADEGGIDDAPDDDQVVFTSIEDGGPMADDDA